MPGVTMKLPSEVRDRIKAIADRSDKTMREVVEAALECYERSLGEASYLEGWSRFQAEDPEGFAEYMKDSEALELGLSDAVPE